MVLKAVTVSTLVHPVGRTADRERAMVAERKIDSRHPSEIATMSASRRSTGRQ
jgi:hypothetical protein